jgi:DNA-binding NarL/FixJ family response regulator
MNTIEASVGVIRLLVVEDHAVVRMGLCALLERCPDIQVVGQEGTLAGAVEAALRLRPDVILLDIRLPDGTGFEACRRIRAEFPEVRVLVLTSFAEEDTVLQALDAGAMGYLLKEADAEALMRGIRSVAAGQSVLDPAVTQRVIESVTHGRNSAVAENKPAVLSAQQLRVLSLVATGKTNKEIAVEMNLSDHTVKNYFSNILDKLQLTRRSQAVAYYIQHLQTPR